LKGGYFNNGLSCLSVILLLDRIAAAQDDENGFALFRVSRQHSQQNNQ
jgi:hypothetical protein